MNTITPQYLLQAKDVTKTVISGELKLTILAKVNLMIKSGESLAILGVSGSGKTTLLSLLASLDQPSSGEILFQDKPISALNENQLAHFRAQNIGFVFQSFHLMPHLTALENVMLPMEVNGHGDAKAKASSLLDKVQLHDRSHHYPRQLSGGEQQRVALARAFVNQPSILFADEPTGNLDEETGNAIIELLFDLNKAHQTTLILVTHDRSLAQRCQHRYRLQQGTLAPCQ